ncbi:MAG: glutathione S-transferase family protein [Sphingopyxis sp.]|uniref:glutathione S-transferase family protein n=1 Tax=Sphingopyxis sp. TaxID=1908224 RepID=UPI002AB8F933|nr:glutathione S-transferase family protein [Sphingopyxis sp.]MDZ3833258.1 glutathione S-transferase family protein [Sphingopyxis sp.]
MADAVTFYTNPMSRGQIVRWMLEEVGVPYEQHLLDYGTTMKDDAYRAINPMGKVPAIVHDGRVVTECAAICAYLAEAFPDAGLTPAPTARADYFRWLFFTAGPVEQAITMTHFGLEPDEQQQQMVGFGTLTAALDALETAVAGKAFVAGDHFTAADVYVGSQIDWGLQFGTIPPRPAFEAYIAPFRERPAYQRAKAIDNALIADMQAAGTTSA